MHNIFFDLLKLLDVSSEDVFIFIIENIIELIIVVVGVYLAYRLNNRQVKKQEQISRQSELQIYKDKFLFNNLVDLQNNLQKYNDQVFYLFSNIIDTPINDIKYDSKLKNKVHKKTNLIFEKTLDYKLTLKNKLMFHSEFESEYNEVELAFERLHAVIFGYFFPSLESKEYGVNYEMVRIFTQREINNLRKSAKEIYEELSKEEKEFTKEASKVIEKDGETIIRDFYIEHFEAVEILSKSVAKAVEKQYKQLGNENND